MKRNLSRLWHYLVDAVRLMPAAFLMGLIGGASAVVFRYALDFGNQLHHAHPWLLWFLPAAGVVTVLLFRVEHLTDSLARSFTFRAMSDEEAGRKKKTKDIPLRLAPVILVCSTLSHTFGASVGRTGAALEVAGLLCYRLARALKIGWDNTRQLVLCGLGAVWAGLFGAPITGTIFAMEWLSVGELYSVGFLPALTSSLTGFIFAQLCGEEPVRFALSFANSNVWISFGQTALLAAACAGLSIVYCAAVNEGERLATKYVPNGYLRIVIGAAAIIGLTLLVGSRNYNGLGNQFIALGAAGGEIHWYDFALKLLFTAVSVATGFRGGKIMPALVIGASFGAFLGPVLGLAQDISTAVALVAMLCGTMNCPLVCIFFGAELFGGEYLLLFAIASGVSYVLSGDFGIYKNQNIAFSKFGGHELYNHKIH